MASPCKEELKDLIVRIVPNVSRQQAEEILALLSRGEEDIDLSDIPEVDFSKDAVRGQFYRGPLVRLNENLQRYFGELSQRKGVPLNDLVNKTLATAIAVAEIAA